MSVRLRLEAPEELRFAYLRRLLGLCYMDHWCRFERSYSAQPKGISEAVVFKRRGEFYRGRYSFNVEEDRMMDDFDAMEDYILRTLNSGGEIRSTSHGRSSVDR